MGGSKVKFFFIGSLLFFALLGGFFAYPIDKEKAKGAKSLTRKIYDRNNVLLREIQSSEYFVSSWVNIESIPGYTVKCFVEKEDKRFYSHSGIDLFSLARAVIQNVKKKKIVSGASTITMQTARIIYSLNQWRLVRKLLESLYALKLEMHFSKEEILELYLNRVYFGNSLYGLSSASMSYFSKSPTSLSLKESAMLAVTLQAPSLYNPLINKDNKKMADRLIEEMNETNLVSYEDKDLAKAENPVVQKEMFVFTAPHLCDRVILELKGKKWIKAFTSADYNLQRELEEIARTSIDPLEKMNVTNCALIIADSRTGDILTMIGSKNYFSENIDGQYNACYGMRSPGSSLKPFTYGLGLLNGYLPSSVIIDEPTYFREIWGDFKPENYDFKFHGPVSLRQALACSYNVPACKVLDSIGVNKLFDILGRMNFETHGKAPSDFGVALTLGSMSASLFELVSAYTVFADRGFQTSPQILDSYMLENGRIVQIEKSKKRKILPDWASFVIADILADNDARYPAFDRENPFKFKFYVGAKTGTSKNYKDNFAIGFTDRYVIGVWAGNNDQSPMVGVSGMTGAGPLFRNAVMTLSKYYDVGKYPEVPDSVAREEVCLKSGLLASDCCEKTKIEYVYAGNAIECKECLNANERRQKIKYPDNGDVFVIDNDLDIKRQMVEVVIEGERKDARVVIDSLVCKEAGEEKRIFFTLKKGEHTIELYSDTLLLDKVKFLVE